jgi:hypothetical protein
MEERREIHQQDFPDLPNLGLLIGVIVAAFIAIGATVFFFGEDQSTMSAANSSPPASERMMKAKRPMTEPGPTTTGQGGAQ